MATFLKYQNGQLIASGKNEKSSAISMSVSSKKDFFQFDNRKPGNSNLMNYIDDVIVMGLMLAITAAII